MRVVCAECSWNMTMEKSGVTVVGFHSGDNSGWSEISYADAWRCSECKRIVLSGFSQAVIRPGDSAWDDTLKRTLEDTDVDDIYPVDC